MAKGYRPVDRDQPFLLPPDMREWLPAGHPVWLVIEAVRLLDTSAFHARRRTRGAGTAGYDPDMMVTLLIWAYANGVTSSRRIERLCGQDVAFRVICAGDAARPRDGRPVPAAVRRRPRRPCSRRSWCCAPGWAWGRSARRAGRHEDRANASKDANRTEAGLRKLARELAARHAEADAAEDALFGEGRRGDDDPGDPFTRPERVAAALAGLVAEREAREAAERDAAAGHLEAAAGPGAAGRRGAGRRRPGAGAGAGDAPPRRPGSRTGGRRRAARGRAPCGPRPVPPARSPPGPPRPRGELAKALAAGEAARAEKHKKQRPRRPPGTSPTRTRG